MGDKRSSKPIADTKIKHKNVYIYKSFFKQETNSRSTSGRDGRLYVAALSATDGIMVI